MNLGGFIDTFKDAIARRVVESYPPLYRPSENGGTLPRLLRKPLGAQADAIRGTALSLKAHRGTTVVGEMGTGKTFIGAAAAYMAGFERILIICPPHLVPKWKREVEMTVPGVRAAIVESITDLERLRLSVGSGPLFAVMSREKAKLSYRWMPAVIQRWAVSKGRLLRDEETGEPFRVPCLSEERLYPKEKALIDMVAAERMEGRRVLVYATHTGTRDITGRMDDMLTRHGFRVAVMKADAVAPERREAWVADRVKQGIDVMICHPRLVQTGLDLIDFPTLIWYETDYSVYVMRQASRRSWRIGQTRPVKVVFMSYKNTLQADALKLVAKKLQSSLAVEGELPEDGLAAYGDDGDDLMMALARKIVSGDEEEDEAETMEEVFAQARNAEAASEEFLVDDGWKVVEVEPEAVEVNGNGHSDEAPEPQQSLFSWAEFMAEEPVKLKGQSRKPQSATLSMFEWALTVEQERENEPVGARR